jgi:hypothetical protein
VIINSILTLIIGSLFASIINLRNAESVIGRSESLTLVDRLHFLTFVYFIVLGIVAMCFFVRRECLEINKFFRLATAAVSFIS